MTSEPTDDETTHLPSPVENGAPLLVAEIVVSRHRPTECTMYPPDATGLDRLAAWITAREGSFVSLSDAR